MGEIAYLQFHWLPFSALTVTSRLRGPQPKCTADSRKTQTFLVTLALGVHSRGRHDGCFVAKIKCQSKTKQGKGPEKRKQKESKEIKKKKESIVEGNELNENEI
jgi:hypothetical protein